MTNVELVRVRTTSDLLRRHYGDTINVTREKALELERKGHGKIIENDKDKDKKKAMEVQQDRMMRSTDYLRKAGFDLDKKKLKIAWIQNASIEGGAELSNQQVVKIGEQCGFDVVGITPQRYNMAAFDACDAVVVCNITDFSLKQVDDIFTRLIERKEKPFIRYDHDYDCLRAGVRKRPLFTESILNVFISPAHMQRYIDFAGEQIAAHSIALPLAIDTETFKPVPGVERKDDYVIIPTPRKGPHNHTNFISHNEDKTYIVMDRLNRCGMDALSGNPQVQSVVPVKAHDMPRYYSQCAHMLHLPEQPGAGERVYFESILCGCTPIVNDNVGHRSWDFADITELKSGLDRAPFTFWRTVENALP